MRRCGWDARSTPCRAPPSIPAACGPPPGVVEQRHVDLFQHGLQALGHLAVARTRLRHPGRVVVEQNDAGGVVAQTALDHLARIDLGTVHRAEEEVFGAEEPVVGIEQHHAEYLAFHASEVPAQIAAYGLGVREQNGLLEASGFGAFFAVRARRSARLFWHCPGRPRTAGSGHSGRVRRRCRRSVQAGPAPGRRRPGRRGPCRAPPRPAPRPRGCAPPRPAAVLAAGGCVAVPPAAFVVASLGRRVSTRAGRRLCARFFCNPANPVSPSTECADGHRTNPSAWYRSWHPSRPWAASFGHAFHRSSAHPTRHRRGNRCV